MSQKVIVTVPYRVNLDFTKNFNTSSKQVEGNDPEGEIIISDGDHTMDELYEHRYALFIALCKHFLAAYEDSFVVPEVWRSSYNSDGSQYEGYFLLGINTKPGEQISYHLPMKLWFDTGFAQTVDRAPEFDGHTAVDVLERLKLL